jgi:hypothetical protein
LKLVLVLLLGGWIWSKAGVLAKVLGLSWCGAGARVDASVGAGVGVSAKKISYVRE